MHPQLWHKVLINRNKGLDEIGRWTSGREERCREIDLAIEKNIIDR